MRKARKRAVRVGFMYRVLWEEIKAKAISWSVKQPGEDGDGNPGNNRLLRRFVSSSGVHCTGRD